MPAPLFMGTGRGAPGVSFYTSREDHEPKLVMHGQIKPGAEPWCIPLDRADVERLRDFCSAWLQGAPADLPSSSALLRREAMAAMKAGGIPADKLDAALDEFMKGKA